MTTSTDTLVLLHVIFRHGDRTPDESAIYPKDPHKNYNYSPYGYGKLTNIGKGRAFRFGQSLRKRYGHFLDDSYKPEHVDAWSSNIDRTKMTLQLVTAALYPPKNKQAWNDDIPWEPIPFKSAPLKDDKIFMVSFHNKLALTAYKNYVNGPGQEVMKSYKNAIDFIEQHSGYKIHSPRDAFNLACTLTIQENMGLKLPEWTKEVYPHRIEEIAMREFEFMTATPQLKSLIAGKLFQKIVEDSMLKIKDQSRHKVHLYSGHDYTVGTFLKVIDVFDGRHPDFCSNVAIELHKINGIYGFMIKYQNGENDEVSLLNVPNVGSFWPIEDFVEDHRDILEARPYDV